MNEERLSRIEIALAMTDCSPEQHLAGIPCVIEDAGWLCGELRKAWAENKRKDAAWREWTRKLLLGMPLTNIGPGSMPEGTMVRWMPAEEWEEALRL